MSIFQQLRFFLDLFEIGEIVTRKELMRPNLFYHSSSIDSYRLWFTHAGYLTWESRGVYKKAKAIPKNLSSRDLRKEAYPNHVNWEEYKHLGQKKRKLFRK